MSENTVKPVLPRKRGKRVVENPEYVAFTRRIVRAYGRRVASGDVEALPELALLVSDVEQATRAAVRGLRAFGYSWSEIAARLGVSRQAAQMRWGDRAERSVLDRRLLRAGLGLSISTLVDVFAEHFPGMPRPETCPGCGYTYPEGSRDADCPSLAVARQVLYRRRGEDPQALRRLPVDQFADLHDRDTFRVTPTGLVQRPSGRPRPRPAWEPAGALVPISGLAREGSVPESVVYPLPSADCGVNPRTPNGSPDGGGGR
jgi:hypothetical protein